MRCPPMRLRIFGGYIIALVTCCLFFFVIIFKIFIKNACLCKYIYYLYTIEITTNFLNL